MNIYTILLVFPLICTPNSCVLIDGEISFDVQIIKDNSDRRHNMFTETAQEKRKKGEKGTLTEQKAKPIKEIYANEADQPTLSNKEIKEDDKQNEEEGRHNVVTGKLIKRERYTTEEKEVNGIDQPILSEIKEDNKQREEKGRHHVVTGKLIKRKRYTTKTKEVDGKSSIDQTESSKKMMTKAVHLECVYQYPETEQMEALLSDMMNQLTRLIVSAHEYSESDVGIVSSMSDVGHVGNKSDVGNVGNKSIVGNMSSISDVGNVGNTTDVGNTSDVGNVGNQTDVGIVDMSDVDDVSDDARRVEKRFRVVSDRSPAVFEGVFKLFTQQYRKFYNTTLQNINRSVDPCEHQPEIKRTWRELLAQSQAMLRRATLSAAQQLLPRNRADDALRAGPRALRVTLARELPGIRAQLLGSLCEGFQLCYSDLL